MKIHVNGKQQDVPEHITLSTIVSPHPGVAVALNGAVVRDWDTIRLSEGDAVEVLTALQGG